MVFKIHVQDTYSCTCNIIYNNENRIYSSYTDGIYSCHHDTYSSVTDMYRYQHIIYNNIY